MADTVISSDTKEAILKETLSLSLKVLENTSDPVVVEEAKKIEAVISQLSTIAKQAVTDAESAKTTATGWWDNLITFDQTLIKKYGVFIARLIEIGTLAAVTVKVFYLG